VIVIDPENVRLFPRQFGGSYLVVSLTSTAVSTFRSSAPIGGRGSTEICFAQYHQPAWTFENMLGGVSPEEEGILIRP
jgi:hypothetical protein